MKSAAFETLSLNLLKTFCVFAEVGKVEETAQKLKITQASVSLQLKKLEEETGQILFKTVGRKKLLSSFARDLFQSIAPPLIELEHRLKEVSKTQVKTGLVSLILFEDHNAGAFCHACTQVNSKI